MRRLIRDFALNERGTLAGRVFGFASFDPSRAPFTLGDASGVVSVHFSGDLPPLGALVEVDGMFEKRGFVATAVRVVARPTLRPADSPEWRARDLVALRRELAARDQLLRSVRAFFHARDFLEVETPTLLAAPGQEPHLLPFQTAFHDGGGARRLWLATSPEYAMKRLLALGVERCFQLGRCYRDGRDEHSPLHSPEFTMVEWYRAWEPLEAIGRDVGELLAAAARPELGGGTVITRGGSHCDLGAPPRWWPVVDAFAELAGVDLAPYLDGDDAAFVESLPAAIRRVGATLREQADSAYFRLMIERVEPQLGVEVPTLLCRYPARHAALAELCADDPRVANRFEGYVLGIELCNAFQELRDADEQERRLRAEQVERVAAGGEALPISEPFLRALRSGLPPCAGVALGVDRLHLLIRGAATLRDVQPFPFGE